MSLSDHERRQTWAEENQRIIDLLTLTIILGKIDIFKKSGIFCG
jgi:hypothetical protein